MAIEATQPAAFVQTFDRTERINNSGHDLHELLTVDEVAALLKVSRSWVYEHTRARGTPRSERLPHIKIGKYVRFDPRAVRAFLERKCRTT
jgi:excisionase family DNA binding protein